MTTGKIIALTRWNFVGKVMPLIFNVLSRLVIAFLPRSKCLLISWLQSPSAVILAPSLNKSCHCLYCFSIYLPWSGGTRFHDLSVLNVEFEASLFTLFFHFHQEALKFFAFCHKWNSVMVWCHLHICGCWYFSWQSWLLLVLHPAWHFTWCTVHIN